MARKRFLTLLLVFMLVVSLVPQANAQTGLEANLTKTSVPSESEVRPDYYLFLCSGYREVRFQTGVSGGTGHSEVTCPIFDSNLIHKVHLELRVYSRNLNPSSTWYQYAYGTNDCTLSMALGKYKCEVNVPMFTFYNPLNTKAYKIDGVMLVDGSPGIQGPGEHVTEWVFNRNAMPYPKYAWGNRTNVPFPSYSGPWSGGDARDQTQFKRNCDAFYAAQHWYPWNYSKLQYHHIQPLAHGGTNAGSNCYILPDYMHQKFTSWWTGFLA